MNLEELLGIVRTSVRAQLTAKIAKIAAADGVRLDELIDDVARNVTQALVLLSDDRLAAVVAARDEACTWWESHLDGFEKRHVNGGDGGSQLERRRIAALRAVGQEAA